MLGGLLENKCTPWGKPMMGVWTRMPLRNAWQHCPCISPLHSNPRGARGLVGGSSSEAGRVASKTGQSWTPLLHCWEHLFTHDWCPQPPPSMRKGPCTLAIYSGSGLLASNEGKRFCLHRTRKEKARSLFPQVCVGTRRVPPPCKSFCITTCL